MDFGQVAHNENTYRGLQRRNECILNYIIATCYLKIFGQLQNKILSLPYITSLKEVMTFQFDESKLDQGQVSITEMENDQQFLLDFLLPAIAVFNISMPNLLKQKDMAKDDTSFLLYTKDTCNKFHLLLVELLGHFNSSLFYLTIAWAHQGIQRWAPQILRMGVVHVVTCGCVLQKLTKGAALKMHLKTISHLLLDIQVSQMQSSMSVLNEDLRVEFDEELSRPAFHPCRRHLNNSPSINDLHGLVEAYVSPFQCSKYSH